VLGRLELLDRLPRGDEVVHESYACVAHGRLPITPLEPFSAHLLGNTAFYEQERYPDGLSQLPSRLALSS